MPEMDTGRQVRIGVHSGPVVADIASKDMYQFDAWGDTLKAATKIDADAGLKTPFTVEDLAGVLKSLGT